MRLRRRCRLLEQPGWSQLELAGDTAQETFGYIADMADVTITQALPHQLHREVSIESFVQGEGAASAAGR